MSDEPPVLQRDRHVRYWLRCLKTLLPSDYTSNDSARMTLAFFTVCALDLLGALHAHTTAAERADHIAWIYRNQHPRTGGFRGFPATDFGVASAPRNERWDPASLPATYFALATLVVLGDDLAGVRREACLDWLPRLQRADGSFGDMLDEMGEPGGGRDTRFCYFAAAVRFMLGRDGNVEGTRAVDVDRLTYDHGIAEAPYREAHAGLAYCAVAALALLDRLPQPATASKVTGLPHLEATVHWLVSRQVPDVNDEEEDEDGAPEPDHHAFSLHATAPLVQNHVPLLPPAPSPPPLPASAFGGFNGRCNKPPDTCYSFWVCGSLAVSQHTPFPILKLTSKILSRAHLISAERNRAFLLRRTQHAIGGFGKTPGAVPDIMHSHLALAALAALGDPADRLEELDPTLCIPGRARRRLEGIRSREATPNKGADDG
ncbi:MAG: Geranylgeranyl transferase type-1 subunit beta [Thelocarpon impressellum]|nr:MAG: Geranylgeranyl transferase type-1 subunit beta [Thelocarpon impressellum]